MMFTQSRLRKAMLLLQQQLSDQSNLLLASLCVEMAQHPTVFLEHAQQQRELEAKVLEADKLYHGFGENQNLQAAYEIYSWAAHKGSAPAMMSLARMHLQGLGHAKQDPSLHRFWVEKAALYGSLDGMTELGLLHFASVCDFFRTEVSMEEAHMAGTARMDPILDEVEAVLHGLEGRTSLLMDAYLSKAKSATIRVGRLGSAASMDDGPGPLLSPSRSGPHSSRQAQVDAAFFGSTKDGDELALSRSASMMKSGTGRHKDLRRGLAFLLMAAQKGHAPAQVRLDLLTWCSVSHTAVLTGLEMLASQVNLGSIYLALKDYPAAFKWLHASAKKGSASGQNLLGILYMNGYGIPKVVGSPLLHTGHATPFLDFREVRLRRIPSFLHQDKVEAMRWFRAAVNGGSAAACNNLGLCYERDFYADAGRKSSGLEEAVRLYRQGAEGANPDAMANLGYLLAKEGLSALALQNQGGALANLQWPGSGDGEAVRQEGWTLCSPV